MAIGVAPHWQDARVIMQRDRSWAADVLFKQTPMEKIRYGLIGCGNISNIYCANGRKFGLELAACADIDLSRAQAKAA